MKEIFLRTSMLLGQKAMDNLESCNVAVFGLGGVGSYAAEALARSGIGGLSLIDADCICNTNINRQIIATHDTIGENKAMVMRRRVLSINPGCKATAHAFFYGAGTADSFDLKGYAYVVDAIDDVKSKLVLIERAQNAQVPIISCMGTGNKLDPTLLQVADIYETKVCPLAKTMRKALKDKGIESLKVVYSTEQQIKPMECCEKQSQVGSVAFVPSVAGLIMAAEVIKDLTSQ